MENCAKHISLLQNKEAYNVIDRCIAMHGSKKYKNNTRMQDWFLKRENCMRLLLETKKKTLFGVYSIITVAKNNIRKLVKIN